MPRRSNCCWTRGLCRARRTASHAARYMCSRGQRPRTRVAATLLTLGSTREGRLEMMRALRRRLSTESGDPSRGGRDPASGRARPSLVSGDRTRTEGVPVAESDALQTGIAGLDPILGVGIPRGNVILLKASTELERPRSARVVYRGASQFGEPGLIVLFEVSPDKTRARRAQRLGWDSGARAKNGLLRIVFTTPRCSARNCSSR